MISGLNEIYELNRLLLKNAEILSGLAEAVDHNKLRDKLHSYIDTITADCYSLYEFICDLQQCETESDIDFLLSEIYPEPGNE